MALSFKIVQPLLQTGTNAASRWLSYIGLGIGVLLLLCSIQMFVNIQQLLGKNTVRKNGYDFISVTKAVTNETMGQPEKNIFHAEDLTALKGAPSVEDAAPLESNQFRVQLNAGDIFAFKTDLFLESLDSNFIDTVPPSFHWSEGEMNVPIILSSEFLEAYNVFAPGQGLPQVSQETATNIPVMITCSGKGREATFNAHVVAFSDRINSVLVPQNFLHWANGNFGEKPTTGFARIYLKTRDANNPDLITFIDNKNYKVNKDKIKFGRTKQTLQGIFSGLGVFGLLVVGMALMLFSFYLQLVIARSRDSLQLLLLLGYSPRWLGRRFSLRFIPIYIFVVLAALAAAQLLQYFFHRGVMYNRPELETILDWRVWTTAVGLTILSIITNFRLVNRLLYKLY